MYTATEIGYLPLSNSVIVLFALVFDNYFHWKWTKTCQGWKSI